MKATDVQKKTEETKVTSLEGELAKLEKEIGLAKEEQVLKEKKEKEAQIRNDLEATLRIGKNNEKLEKAFKEVIDDVWLQEKRVNGLRIQRDEKTETLKLEVMGKTRQSCESLASKLLDQVKRQEEEFTDTARRLICLYHLYDRNIPRRYHQISSTKFIRMEREVHKRDESGPFQTETEFFQLHKVPAAEAVGWRVVKGQDLTPEPLGLDNSILINGISISPIIERILELDFHITFSLIDSELSEEDISSFSKQLE